MNTFLTEFEHGLNASANHDKKKVNFAGFQSIKHDHYREQPFTSPYVDFYITNMEKYDQHLEKRMHKLLLRKSADSRNSKINNLTRSSGKNESRYASTAPAS